MIDCEGGWERRRSILVHTGTKDISLLTQFIAHSIGGAVDGVEMNVFVQRRDLNRGWSAEGKTYREMESYCSSRSGTFCFSRPIYLDGTARPSFVEFGLLKEDNKLWVEC